MSGWRAFAKAALAGLATVWASAGPANAQVVSNTTVRSVPGSCTTLATSLADPILFEIGSLPTSLDVADVDISALYTHPNRNATYISLIQPVTNGGYRRIPLKPNTGPAVANLNVTFSDEAAQAVNTGTHADADPLTPVFNDRVRSTAALSAADGESDGASNTTPAGQGRLWYLELCNTSATAGELRRVDIDYAVASDVADLSLDIITSGTPVAGQPFTVTFRVANTAGGLAATGVRLDALFGTGFAVTNVTGASLNTNGAYALPGSIPAGGSRDVVFTLNTRTSGSYSVFGEISASDQRDPDSGPGNRVVGEDDTDSANFSPTTTPTNAPPALQCALGRPVNTLDWKLYSDTSQPKRNWPENSNAESYTIASTTAPGPIPVSVTATGNVAQFAVLNLNNTPLDTPVSTADFTGGSQNYQEGVVMAVDFTAYSQSVTLTFDYGSSAIGAGGIQIPITDVDRGGWTDRITATATLGGSPVTPIYTPGPGNVVRTDAQGRQGITGTLDANFTDTSGNGNMWITFPSSVDKVVITYSNSANTDTDRPTGNIAAAPANPAYQFISIENLTFCDPEDPRLTAQKVVETDGYYLPGETVTYRLQASSAQGANVGAESVTLDDTLPGNLRFVSAAVSGLGSSGTFEPALPAAQTDCAGNGNTACRIRYVGGELAREQTGEVTITAVVK